MKSHSFPALLSNLHTMLGLICKEARSAGFNEHDVAKIELAAEEALVNIIQYAYPKGQGDVEIAIDALKGQSITLVLKDKGVPYNPVSSEQPKRPENSDSDQLPGGYGIFLFRTMMDEIKYTRENNQNVLTLQKQIPKPL
jgi:serine/threonine-protein kinase RsbW